jgi:hypothetical protein
MAGSNLYHALKAQGFQLPAQTVDVTLTFSPDSVIQMHILKNVTQDELKQIGKALHAIGDPIGDLIAAEPIGDCIEGLADGCVDVSVNMTEKKDG